MKAKLFNKKTAPAQRGSYDRAPMMSVNPRAGKITFSKELVDTLGLTRVKGITFIQDEERPKDWYIKPSDDADAFTVRQTTTSYMMQNKILASEIMSSLGLDSPHKFIVAREPDGDLFPIITKSAIPSKRGSAL